ncbi:MAG: hypothetical protein ACOYMA_15370 [Bacteroidia bacterium]
MKNLKNIILLVVLTQALLTSCKKPEMFKNETTTTNSIVAKSVKEIKAPNSFNWNTSNTVNFTFKGLVGDVRKSTLTILAEDNSVLFKKLQSASENFSGSVEIPAHVGKITVRYNNNATEFTISSNKFAIELK